MSPCCADTAFYAAPLPREEGVCGLVTEASPTQAVVLRDSSSNLGSFITCTMAAFGPVSSKVADVQLSHGSVTVPGGDLRAAGAKARLLWGEEEDGSIEGTEDDRDEFEMCAHAQIVLAPEY